jgi:hypothetical protein
LVALTFDFLNGFHDDADSAVMATGVAVDAL